VVEIGNGEEAAVVFPSGNRETMISRLPVYGKLCAVEGVKGERGPGPECSSWRASGSGGGGGPST
jgi:hypothetical protein